ncbi:alpha-1-acid glycoprotein 2-like [Antennarius striatus]|uniref:alpha-1-acid glycoprotein 2-like n=1 Tax=Antennarius striatus TaxID=241820 RepID=UPI0035B34E78
MLFLSCVIAILSLIPVSKAAPSEACEELVRPSDQLDLQHLAGRRALVAGSVSNISYLQLFAERDSATIHFANSTSESKLSYTRSIRLDKCYYGFYNISLDGSNFTYDGTDKSNFSAYFVHTSCNDCLLMLMTVDSGKRQHFYFFSRRKQLEQTEMDEFIAQVECLGLPPPVVMDATKDLCPENPSTEEIN